MNSTKLNTVFYRILGPINFTVFFLFGLASLLTHSYYQAGFCGLILLIHCVQYFKTYSNPQFASAFNQFFLLFIATYYGYKGISEHKRDINQDRFGPAFNEKRLIIGTPIIPKDWKIDYRASRTVKWIGDTSAFGHQSKHIGIDSTGRIEFEYDEYKLKAVNRVTRGMSIYTRYARGKSKDSIFYWYDVADSNRMISKQMADSLFNAEKIKSD